MKPKTKHQKLVFQINKTIKDITDAQKQWALKHIPERYFCFSRNRFYCQECQHKWQDEKEAEKGWEHNWNHDERGQKVTDYFIRCPNCKRKLIFKPIEAHIDNYTFTVVTTHKGFQIVRNYEILRYMYLKKPSKYFFTELSRIFINSNGKSESMYAMNSYLYSLNSLELRKGSGKDQGYRRFHYSGILYPRIKVLPIVKRNGFHGTFGRIAPQMVIWNILNFPMAETLYKAKQYSLLSSFCYSHKVEQNWRSVRICLRNNYHVKNASNWLDHIQLLKEHKFDIYNSKYVCPDDLYAEHQKLIAFARRKREKEKAEKHEQDIRAFYTKKGKYFKLKVVKDNLRIRPLKSIEEFEKHGDRLLHCIYVNKYYLRDSLMLAAFINNRLIENIEFDLNKLEVLQARGYDNEPSKHHSYIVKTVNKELPKLIRQLK